MVLAEPGPFTSINFSKSDAWAIGAIAYEIFGQENPFYSTTTGVKPMINSATYTESDLPPLPDNVPAIISHLVHNLLSCSPSQVSFNSIFHVLLVYSPLP